MTHFVQVHGIELFTRDVWVTVVMLYVCWTKHKYRVQKYNWNWLVI